MLNPRLAARYAKSLLDIAIEQGKTDTMYSDMQGINQICNDSHDFVLLMKSPIVKADSKLKIANALFEGKIDSVTLSFIRLIINKGREFFLPEIASAFIAQFKKHNNINEVVLTTSHPMDESMKNEIDAKIQQQFQGMGIDLTTKVDESLIGGFILEANNNMFDASILRDLNDIKKQFLKNEFVPDLR